MAFTYHVSLNVGRYAAEFLIRQLPPDELEMIAKMPAYFFGIDDLEDDEDE